MPLSLEIVTPERSVFKDTVDHVVLPTRHSGEIDVLPGHLPLMGMTEPGELTYYKNGKAESIAIDRGFIEVVNDVVHVLTESAIEVELIDPATLDDARRRAETALAEARESGEDPAILEELETKARFSVIQKLIHERRS